jgi:flagellar protein FlbD
MIRLTRLNRAPMVLNADLIEHIEVTPDTVITLTTGQILRVRESAEEVVRLIVQFRRRISAPGADPGELCRELPDCGATIPVPDRSGE